MRALQHRTGGSGNARSVVHECRHDEAIKNAWMHVTVCVLSAAGVVDLHSCATIRASLFPSASVAAFLAQAFFVEGRSRCLNFA